MEDTPGRTFYQRQIAVLETGDLNALLAQYHPDATMVGFDFIVKGHEAIMKHFEGYLKRHVYNICGKLGVQSRTQVLVKARALKLF